MAPPPSIMESLFQRTLDDLIKGLRLHLSSSPSLSAFLSAASAEIRRELSSSDPHTKSAALLKLTYLRHLHNLPSPAPSSDFAPVELSSSPLFHIKRLAYLSASLSFSPATDVLLLLPNQLRKDLSSPNPAEASLALEFISVVASPDLSRDLTPEIFTLLSSNKLFVRKKAIAAVLTVFRTYPDAVRVCFKRLVESLDHSDLGTVSVTVSVFCELAMSDAKSYLPLAPEFYKILVDSRNNWVLIKVLKIFAKLAPLEPRLAKRVVEPICDHMRRTGAKSLMLECIRTVFGSLVEYESAVRLAVEKVREFMTDEDPNLKYLGLQALSMLTPVHSWAVAQYKEVVIRSLSDTDPNVKLEALGLVMAMVSEDNMSEFCKVLVHYALKSDPLFCNEILGSILSTCGANFYEIIVDFDWYVSLLGEISRIPHCQKGDEIERQIIDIGIRVRDVRPELVRVSRDLVIDPALLGNPFLHRILSAAAWVSGEYVELLKNPIEIIEALLQPRTDLLPPTVRAVYIQSAFKVLVFCLHSYFFPNEAASLFLRANGLDPDGEDPVSDRDNEKNSDLANEDFNPRISSQSLEGIAEENDGDTIAAPEKSSFSASLKNGLFTYESIVYLLDISKTALCPLLGNHEVEILERARNVLGLVELIEPELSDTSNKKGEKVAVEDWKNSEIVRLMHAAFSGELGLVPTTAQERVQIPEGLILLENLDELKTFCVDVELATLSSFSLVKPRFVEKSVVSSISYDNEDRLEPASESTSLLTEHRKRHGLYYLPSDMRETTSYAYPPANEHKLSMETSGDMDKLVKLTEQSLVSKKSKQTKPRPVVVKLDGDDIGIRAKKLEAKDDSISVAVRDVVLGNETRSSDKPSTSKKRGKEKVMVVHGVECTDKLAGLDNAEVGNLSRRSKHRSHGKERKHRSSRNKINEREEMSKKDKKRSGHEQGKNEGQQRAGGDVHAVPQTAAIPDFLL